MAKILNHEEEPRRVNYNLEKQDLSNLFSTPEVLPEGKALAKNTAEMAKWNVLNQAMQSLTESIGMSQGAPIGRRKDTFAPTALQTYQRQTNINQRNKYGYDLLELRKETEKARLKAREIETANSNNLQAALTEFQAGKTDERLNKTIESREGIAKRQQEGANWRTQKTQEEYTKRYGKNGTRSGETSIPSQELYRFWQENPHVREKFMKYDKFDKPIGVLDFSEFDAQQMKQLEGMVSGGYKTDQGSSSPSAVKVRTQKNENGDDVTIFYNPYTQEQYDPDPSKTEYQPYIADDGTEKAIEWIYINGRHYAINGEDIYVLENGKAKLVE